MTDLTLFSQDPVPGLSSMPDSSTAASGTRNLHPNAKATPSAAPAALGPAAAPAAPAALGPAAAPAGLGPAAAPAVPGPAAAPTLPGPGHAVFPSSGPEELVGRVLGSLDVLVDGLRALSGAQVEERLRLVGRCESRLAAVKSEAVAELAAWRGEAHAAGVLQHDLKQSRGAAKGEVKLASQMAEVPATAEALDAGDITPRHARLIAEAAEAAPPEAPIDEEALLAAAGEQPADLFGRTVRGHLNELAGDDLVERRRRQRQQRELRWKQDADGMYELVGRFDPVAGARIETALTATANKLWHAENPKNRATAKQRLADALELLVTCGGHANPANANRAGQCAAQGVDLLVIADYDTVAGQLTNPRLGDGTPLSAEELLRLACDANILPAIFDRKGQPLWLGRGRRQVSAAQRTALVARDGGCIGCGANPNWCQAHHIRHWAHGGTTDIDNLCLLCSHCHHHELHTNGADIIRGPDGKLTLQRPDQRAPPTPP